MSEEIAETKEIGRGDAFPDYAGMYRETLNKLHDIYAENYEVKTENAALRAEVGMKNLQIKTLAGSRKNLNAQVSVEDRGSWMNLRFGVKVKDFLKELVKWPV